MKKINLPANFLSYLESGKLKVSYGNLPAINFSSLKDERVIDIIDIPVKISDKPGIIKQLSEAKDLAKNLKNNEITL